MRRALPAVLWQSRREGHLRRAETPVPTVGNDAAVVERQLSGSRLSCPVCGAGRGGGDMGGSG